MRLPPLPDTFSTTRDELQRVAVHIVARARQQATGRFGLRVTSGGFGTPSFGDDVRRVRLSRDLLVVETAGTDGSSTAATPIAGSSLATLAATAGVDLAADLDVGHDTPPLGDAATPLVVDVVAVRALSAWYTVVGEALDAFVAARPGSSPSAIQLWPEHFDVALDAAYDPEAPDERRVNLGGSPGDDGHARPYLYVGPWTADRPGDAAYWNAPFGAVLGYDELVAASDPVDAAADFFVDGFDRLAGAG
jgi:hypothetical protein